jgi:hypothetical protein
VEGVEVDTVDVSSPHRGSVGAAPSILITTTVWWPFLARFAQLLQSAGCSVSALSPRGHAVRVAPITAHYDQDALRPLRALSHAIACSRPAFILPGDDRALAHLSLLHGNGTEAERRLVEDSLGSPRGYPARASRALLLDAAAKVGIATPATMPIETLKDLRNWMARVDPPWVLKADGTWGGAGVKIFDRAETGEAVFRGLGKKPSLSLALRRLISNQDAFRLGDWLAGAPRTVSAQAFIRGRPGNLAMVCRDGVVLAAIVVEAVACWGSTGPTTIGRIVHRPDLVDGAGRLARLLGFNGFVGLDFMVDENDDALVVEMNSRFTYWSILRLGDGCDLIGAFMRSLTGRRNIPREPAPAGLIANFPLAWHWNDRDPRLAECHCDAPWDQPALMAAMLKLPRDHSWLARGLAAIGRPLNRPMMGQASSSMAQTTVSSIGNGYRSSAAGSESRVDAMQIGRPPRSPRPRQSAVSRPPAILSVADAAASAANVCDHSAPLLAGVGRARAGRRVRGREID